MKHVYYLCMLPVLVASCSHKAATEDTSTPSIEVARAVTDSVTLYKTYPGFLSSNRSIQVVARVNGQLLAKEYDGGQYVEKGKVLFRIEDNTYRDRYNQTKANLATAQSTYEYNKKHYEAIKKAFEGDAVSQMDLIQAESNYRQSEANVASAKAALSTAATNLGYCVITAPISGHINSSPYSAGAYIGGEGSPVEMATIYEDDMLNANFYIEDEQYINILRGGNTEREDLKEIPITFSESFPHPYTANLYYMAPSIDRNTGTMKLQAKLKNTYGELKDGMYCSISLPTGVDSDAILVKDASIGTDQLGKYLYVVNDSDKIVYTHIKVGEMANDSMRIVTEGLAPDARYVTKALMKVRSGMKVNPVLTK
ncbi:MAG: efflux RND transporter periplasmic adaptor subunit [Duncaniella sp.]|nr:efflux RND transporter periplasmic adaptor subunit [Duncaniella sp.]